MIFYSQDDNPNHLKEQNETNNWITDKQTIANVFSKAHKHHCLLTATVGKHPDSYTTTVLGVKLQYSLIALDQLNPVDGHLLFVSDKTIHISGNIESIEFNCDLQLLEVKNTNKLPYYLFQIPQNIIYRQRRNHYRVPLTTSAQLRGYNTENHRSIPISGHAIDLSMHGIGFILESPEHLHQGDKISNCELNLNDGESLRFNLEVCFIHHDDQSDTTRVGGRFIDMNKREKTHLAKSIRTLERRYTRVIRS